MQPPPLLLTVAGRKYHYPSVQVIAHLLPRKFWELLFIARCAIGCLCKNSFELIFWDVLVGLTALGRSTEFCCLLPHTSWRNTSSRLVAAHRAFAQAFMCDIVSHLGLRSSTSCWPPLAWTFRHRAESCRFILIRLYRGRYLKYWYSIFKEQQGQKFTPHYTSRKSEGLITIFF